MGDVLGKEMFDQPFLHSFHDDTYVALDTVIAHTLSLADYQAFISTVKLNEKYGRGNHFFINFHYANEGLVISSFISTVLLKAC